MLWNIVFAYVIVMGFVLLYVGATFLGGVAIGAGLGAGMYRALEG